MKNLLPSLLSVFLLCSATAAIAGGENETKLDKVKIDVTDKASLQRGWKIYANYCQGCHSLQYTRYEQLARDLAILDSSGQVPADFLKQNLIFTSAKPTDHILSAMRAEEAKNWFGVAPPDLTLVARVRGVDWLYTYLRTFYTDEARPWKVNNLVFPDVGMPHVLSSLQGEMSAVKHEEKVTIENETKNVQRIDHLQMRVAGRMSEAEYDAAITDLVNFLGYVAEPAQVERKRLGPKVLLFLFVFSVMAYFLKKEFWKNIK